MGNGNKNKYFPKRTIKKILKKPFLPRFLFHCVVMGSLLPFPSPASGSLKNGSVEIVATKYSVQLRG
jgi:hypothetical protein